MCWHGVCVNVCLSTTNSVQDSTRQSVIYRVNHDSNVVAAICGNLKACNGKGNAKGTSDSNLEQQLPRRPQSCIGCAELTQACHFIRINCRIVAPLYASHTAPRDAKPLPMQQAALFHTAARKLLNLQHR